MLPASPWHNVTVASCGGSSPVPPRPSGEAAHGVSAEQFATMQAQGAFALSWKANGLSYGIPIDIEQWLAAGQDVLVNGSRGYLPQAPDGPALVLLDNSGPIRQTVSRLLALIQEA